MFSSPSRGSYISTVNGVAYTLNATEAILVPVPGFLYLYISFDDLQMAFSEFSSPSRGSYISTIVIAIIILIVTVLVPFPGFLYLYAEKLRDAIAWERVLVPFPGFLYLYDISDYLDEYWGWFSSPSRGSYISTGGNYYD